MSQKNKNKEINKYINKISKNKDKKTFDEKVEEINNKPISKEEYLRYYKTQKRADKYKKLHDLNNANKLNVSLYGFLFNFGYFSFYKCYLQSFISCLFIAISLYFNNFFILLISVSLFTLNCSYYEQKQFENIIAMNRINFLSTNSKEYLDSLTEYGNKLFSVSNYIFSGLGSILYIISFIGLILSNFM